MELIDLAKQLKEKSLDSFYIFTGPEVAIMDVYLNRIEKASSLKRVRADSVASFASKLKLRNPLSSPVIYVVRDDSDFIKAENDWHNVIEMIGSNKIILLYSSIDKRSKFYKQLKDSIVSFDYLTALQLSKHIQKDVDLSKQQSIFLAECCECDYSRVLLECDKIKHYAAARDLSDGEAFEELRQKGGVFQPIGDITFDFVDAMLQRNTPALLKLSTQLKQIQESPLLTLSTLYTGFRNAFLVASTDHPTTESTGLTGWQIKTVRDKIGYYDSAEYLQALDVIHQIEKKVKLGLLDPEIAVDTVIVTVVG